MPSKISVTRCPEPKPKPPAADLGFGRSFTDHMFIVDHEVGRGWMNPRVVPYAPLSVDPAAGALHYGQTLFEGMKAFRHPDGRAFLFRPDRHAARLNASAERLCMPTLPEGQLVEALRALVGIDEAWIPDQPGTSLYVRPAMIATEGFLGVRPARRYALFIICSPVGNYWGPNPTPLKLWVETHHVRAVKGGIGSAKAGANYVASLLAAEEAKKRGFSQVLWLDASHRFVEEVGTMNVFFRIGDRLVTPALSDSLLAGVTRDSVITLLRRWDVAVEERPLPMEEVAEAHARGRLREVFGTGTAATISAVGDLTWGDRNLHIGERRGEIAERLYQALTAITSGREPDPDRWLLPVAVTG